MNTKESMQAVRAPGQMGFSAVGSLWMLAWCLQKHARDWSTLCLVVLTGLVIFLWAWCDFRIGGRGSTPPMQVARRFQVARDFGVVTVLEGMLCGAGLLFNLIFVLQLLGHPAWLQVVLILLTSWVCFALGKALQHRPYYLTGFALCVAALADPLSAGLLSPAATCFATGSILWICALSGLFVEHFNAGRAAVRHQPHALSLR